MKRGELYRKILHLSGLTIPLVYQMVPGSRAESFVLALVVFTLASLFFDLMRFKVRAIKELIEGVFGRIMRDSERGNITAFSLYLVGSSAVVLGFRKEIAVASITVLSLCDFLAALVGITLGRVRVFRGKTFEGSLAFFFSASIILFLAFGSVQAALIAGFASSVAEMLSPGSLDNLIIPLVTALFLKVLVG